MARPLFSQSWHSVAALKPRLIGQIQLLRHVYRGQVWYVAADPVGGKFHRLTPSAHAFVTHMNGEQTVQQIWDLLCRLRRSPAADTQTDAPADEDIPTQDEIVNLLTQLHAADLLQPDIAPDAARLYQRYTKRKSQSWKQWLTNPMSLKVPLLDPDNFLTTWVNRLHWIFSPAGVALWLAVVLPALVLAGQHATALTGNLSDTVLSSSNLLVMAAVFPVVKLLHELGHGFATKAWGGTVHSMGVMLLVFAPAPYVDASASSAFPSKYRRAVVGAAGMLTEVFLAALAMYVWLLVEPGLVRAVAFNVMVVAGVSTLVVNGNPLLRYDAYFILCDLIEMPNMAQRGQKYLQYLWNKVVFRVTDQEEPHETPSERRWLVGYSILSWCYRVFVTLSIALFIAGEFFFFGVLIALWSVFGLIVLPLWKATRYVLNDPVLQRNRQRAVRTYFGLFAGLLVFLLFIPMPSRTQTAGVVWLPEQSMLRAGANGFFSRWLVTPGSIVGPNVPVLVLDDPLLVAELEVARAKVAEAQARLNIDQFTNPAKAEIGKRQLEQEQVSLARAEERFSRLVVMSSSGGIVTAAKPYDMPGQYFKKGELLGHVLESRQLIARVVVPQADIDLVRSRYKGAELRMADSMARIHPTSILRETPGAQEELPTAALSIANGGLIATDPQESSGTKALERIFVFDMELPPDAPPSAFGERVYVRFSHTFEPLAVQGWRRLRQLFLSRLTT